MTYEETAILNFLRGYRDDYIARREIARKALKRTVFEENPHWADAPLASLVEQRLVEQNESGHYRIKQSED
jgi:DNA-binding IclR family transcriptional regulator